MRKRLFGILIAVAALVSFPLASFAEGGFTLPTGQVTGLGADAGRKVYWVTGEQGGSIDAVSGDGKKLGTVQYRAETQSVQALSFHNNNAYIGDIGGSREQVRVIRLSSLAYGKSATATTWRLRYPDGAHEARGFAVSPKGNLYIVTGGDKPAVYRLTGAPDASRVGVLSRVADAPAGVADMVFLSDGKSLALRTADQIQVLDTQNWTLKASAPLSGTGEAISTALGGTGLITVDGQQASATAVPTSIVTIAPTPSASPDGTGENGATTDKNSSGSSDQKEPEVKMDASTDVSRMGTYTALGLAALVSVVSCLTVFLKK